MLVWACLAMPADARQTAGTAEGAGSDSDPLACWWRTDRSAAHVGEQFTLTLTCAVTETADVRVVADRDRLDPAALDLTPFEIVGGTRDDDIEAAPRRYFQYSYTLRLFSDEHFDKDVDIPSIPVTYHVETPGATATRGRDQVYLLPALPVHVRSLVPVTATDIREAAPDTFGDIDRRAFRATEEFAAAGVLFTLAVALAAVGTVRMVRPRLGRAAAARGLVSPAEVLRGCIREARRVKSEVTRAGWTSALVGEALTVLRVACAAALDSPIAQRLDGSTAAQEGQLTIRKGTLRTKRVLVSAATTPTTFAARLAGANGATSDPRLRSSLEELGESLRLFAAARYRRNENVDAPALDKSFERAIEMLQRLYAMQQWPARTADALSHAAERLKGALWSR